MTDRKITKMYAKLEQLEQDRSTNWGDYGQIGKACDYKWDEKKGRWKSFHITMMCMVLSTLVASDEGKAPFLEFLDKVMATELRGEEE